ncbi:MAG: tetratricopeptide repeat protein [bacterium]|nr:MAG: tetratricopeptide repeat protein [bacterium]
MRRFAAIAIVLVAASCATAPPTGERLSPREREALLLREIDRTKKGESDRIKQLMNRAKREGQEFLSREESEARTRSIQLYRSLIDRFPDNRENFMAESSFRLAELLFEAERERIRRAVEEKGEGADLIPDFSRAIEAYRAVVDRFADHPLVEDALYGLAYCFTEQGDPDRAAAEYVNLIDLYPGTRYALEIHMRLGEYYFEMEDLDRAIEHYKVAAESGDDIFSDKALYKLGWCYYNQERYDEAIDTFFTLIDLTASRQASTDSLADESIEIIARSYAEKGGTPSLIRRLSGREKDRRSSAILLRLAELFKDRSLYPEAIGTFRTYIRLFPQGRDLPSALAQLAETYHIRGDDQAALDLTESFPDIIGPSSPWYSAAPEAERRKAVEWTLGNLESASERRRAMFQAGGTKSELERALKDVDTYYRISTTATPCRIRQLKGHILVDLDVYPDAALNLNQLAASPECSDWKVNAAIKSINYQIGVYDRQQAIDLDLLASSVRLLEEADPDNPITPKTLLAMGEILANSGKRSESRNAFARVLKNHPRTEEAGTARLNIARTFFQEGDFQQSAAWFKEAWRNARGDVEAGEARRLHIYSLFKYAEELGQQGQTLASAERFDRIFRMYPDADVAQISLYNAGKLYRQMGLEMRATDLFEELAATYQESDLASEALQMSILILEALGDPNRAALDALALADISAGEDRRNTLVKSADLFRSGGSYDRAAEARRRVIEEYRAPAERLSEQLLFLGQDLESAGRWEEAREAYLEAIGVHREHADVKATAHHAANAQLRISQESFSRYQSVKIGPPVEETVAAKRELLQEVIRNFVAAGAFRVAEVSTAANYYIGRALEHFKDEILSSPRPEELTGDLLEEYDLLLQEMAYPFEEKALEAYRVNIERAVEFEILDPWIEKSYHRMAELAPWAYLREEKLHYPITAVRPEMPPLPPLPTLDSVRFAVENGSAGERSSTP